MARKDEIQNIREVLLKRREAIRKALKGDLTMLHELNQQSGGDVIDAAWDSAADDIESQLAEVHASDLGDIERALERMEAGSYGDCAACGKKIPLTRLKALPFAALCIDCKRISEQTGNAIPGSEAWMRVSQSMSET